jgi:alpha,alpha-trehalose phosphorylase
VVAAHTGHLALACDYFIEAAVLDLDDLQHNTRDGLHIASLAGACRIPARGFGGMRRKAGMLAFSPRLPQALTRIKFRAKSNINC